MRLCAECGSALSDSGWACTACGHEPPRIDGIPALAPELSDTLTGFDPKDFAALAKMEAGSFWFTSRNALMLHALHRFAPQARSFLEIGCGTGFVLTAIGEAFPEMALTGSEIHASGLAICRERLEGRADFLQLDARRLPFREEFDAIGLFDVLEHIAEDEVVLGAVHEALRPGGILLATVPQHPALWSPSDDIAHHVRRYEVGELDRKVAAEGFSILASTSFVFFLLPAMALSRVLAKRSDDDDPGREMRLGTVANRFATLAMTFERTLIKAGIRFPIGGSRLVVARKGP